MKRINIYITPETDKIIDNMSEMFGESRSEVIRKSITEYSNKHKNAINEFMKGLDELIDSPNETQSFNIDEEIIKCKDIEYFMRNYVKINTQDSGIIQFNPYDHQISLAEIYSMYRRIIINQSRQMGVSVTTCAYILHGLIFDDNKTYAIINATKESAEYTLNILKTMIKELPKEFKNMLYINIESKKQIKINNNYVIAKPMKPSAIRGMTIDFLYIENFSYTSKKIADEFIANAFPSIISSKTSKIIIVSTPNGPNHFYKMWSDAISNYNDFHPIKLHYSLFKDKEKINTYNLQKSMIGQHVFNQEYDCEFNLNNRGTLSVI